MNRLINIISNLIRPCISLIRSCVTGNVDKKSAWQRMRMVVAAIVVFTVTYSLVLPAIAFDQQAASSTPGIDDSIAVSAVGSEENTVGQDINNSTLDEHEHDEECISSEENGLDASSESIENMDSDGKGTENDTVGNSAEIEDADTEIESEGHTNTESINEEYTNTETVDAENEGTIISDVEYVNSDTLDDDDTKIIGTYISASGDNYEVTVTYGEDSGIPDGSVLEITEFKKNSTEYQEAYETVLRSKEEQSSLENDAFANRIGIEYGLEQNNNSDRTIIDILEPSPVEMEVLDISIFDENHEMIEPQAPVSVSIVRNALPEDAPVSLLESTLTVDHLNDHTGNMTVETVAEPVIEGSDQVEVREESIQIDFLTDSFSTYTISWGGGLSGTGISGIQEGQYIIYARDAYNGNYYALLPQRNNDGTLKTVQLTNTNGVISYTGDVSDLYWTYSKYYDSYRFSFRSGTTTYYLAAGTFGRQVRTSTNGANGYGNANTTLFGQYNDHLHAAGDTFLRCYNGVFQFITDVSSGWENRSQVFFAEAPKTKNVTVHYGYMNGNSFVEFSNENDGNVPAGTIIPGPAQHGDQWDLEKTIPGYRYVTARLNNPTNGREISSLLNTDPPYKANINNTFENADQSAYPSYTSSTAPTSFVSEWRYRQLSKSNWNPTGEHNKSSTEPITGYGITKPVSFTESDKDIYVIYEKGSMSGGSGDGNPPDLGELNAPTTDKQVASNHDGTYDVTLSAKGEKRNAESSTKANVVVVLDTSWSMYEKVGNTRQSRMEVAKSAIGSLADKLFALNANETDTIELAFVNFAQRVRNEEEMRTIYSGTDATSFKNMINGLDCASGTNWDDALYAANHIYFNDNDPTYIVFVTDGDPISCAHPYGKYDDWDGGTYYTGRSNYEYALAAKNQADLIVSNNKTLYTIGAFGQISNLQAIGGTYLGQANNTTAINGYFDNIIADIQSALGYKDITINDGITALSSTGLARGDITSLRYYRSGGKNADGSEKYDHTANNGHGVEWKDAPAAYLLEVKSENGGTKYYKNGTAVSLSSLTDLTEAEYLEKYPVGTRTVIWDINEGSEELVEDGVTYTMIFTMWPSQEAYDMIADLNNGTIDYDKDLSQAEKDQVFLDGNVYYLKTNTKATVDYTSVKLINGKISGTPTSASAPIEDPKGKMNLDTSIMTVRKEFAHLINEADPYEEIVFYLLVDGKYYNKDGTLSDTLDESKVYAINLPKGGKWEDTVYIAPGLMRGGEILETGHNYSLEEKIVSGNPYEYEFAPQTVRPMVITAVPTFLVEKDRFNTNTENKKEYTFNDTNSSYIEVTGKSDADGTYYVASENNGSLVGVNHKTSELDITKIINDPQNLLTDAQENAETFTYRVTLQIPDGCDPSGIVGYEYVPRTQSNAYTLFGYQTGQSAFIEDIERFNGKTYRAWNTLVYDALIEYDRVTENGRTFIRAKRDNNGNIIWKVPASNGYHTITYDMTLKQDEVIRFTNLPTGTKYSIQEIYANKYPADNVGGKTDGRTPVADESNLAAEGYEIEQVQHTGGTLSVDKSMVTGTIESPDMRYYNQYKNLMKTAPDRGKIKIKKIDKEHPNTVLANATFEIHSGSNKMYLQNGKILGQSDVEKIIKMSISDDGAANAMKENGISASFKIGEIEISAFVNNTVYELKEIEAPAGYIITTGSVYFKAEKNDEDVICLRLTDQDGNILKDEQGNPVQDNDNASVADNGLTISIKNEPGAVLPNTGGPGTNLIYLLGIMLTGLATAGLVMKRRSVGFPK